MKQTAWLILFALVLLAACQSPEPACPEQPPAAETTAALLNCLDRDSLPEDARRLLQEWGRLNDEWGSVTGVDLLPARGEELVVAFHADLEEVTWNPQGSLIVLAGEGGAWQVAFDGSTIPASPKHNDWDNWAYRYLGSSDVTGDGEPDLLLERFFSNGLHVAFQEAVLLTTEGGNELDVAFQKKTDSRSEYRLGEAGGEGRLQFVRYNQPGRAAAVITRTYHFTGDSFVQAAEMINPRLATVSVEMADGTAWYAFDPIDGVGGVPAGSEPAGLYRVQDEGLSHVPLTATVRALEAGPEGSLYAAVGCGLLRNASGQASRGSWETMLPLDECALLGSPPASLALGESGDLWLGNPFALAHYDNNAWTTYDIHARRLLVAPDGTVWAEGWDGRAESGCCFTHLQNGSWTTYTYSARLPVAPALEAAIRELKQ